MDNNLLDKNISELDLKVSTYCHLKRIGVNTLNDLINLNNEDLNKLGLIEVKEIKEVLGNNGVKK